VSLNDQLKQILEVVGRSLSNVHTYHKKQVETEARRQESLRQKRERLERVKRGEWHDGRLDCVAGNGVMSELGIGDEKFGPDDTDSGAEGTKDFDAAVEDETKPSDLEAMDGLPVVVIRGFEDKVGGKSELLDVVAQWATSLVDNKASMLHASRSHKLIYSPICSDGARYCAERQQRERQKVDQRYRSLLWLFVDRSFMSSCSKSLETSQHHHTL
jgi:hypothetical protein